VAEAAGEVPAEVTSAPNSGRSANHPRAIASVGVSAPPFFIHSCQPSGQPTPLAGISSVMNPSLSPWRTRTRGPTQMRRVSAAAGSRPYQVSTPR
jgi:hypothetical protein